MANKLSQTGKNANVAHSAAADLTAINLLARVHQSGLAWFREGGVARSTYAEPGCIAVADGLLSLHSLSQICTLVENAK